MRLDIRQAARLLRGHVAGRNSVLCPGPGHSRTDRSLSVTFTADGFITNSFASDDWRDCRDHVKAALGWADDQPAKVESFAVDTSALTADEEERIEAARQLWMSAVPIKGTLAEAYLSFRGLAYDGEAIRFRPACRSMIAMMTDAITGEPCGVHRTFLDADGRKVDRKMKGRAKGAVVRLYEHEAPFGLAVAEGIETALATDFRPIWACLTAGGISALPVLGAIEALTIFADNDVSGTGERAAEACASRWFNAGVEVTIRMPIAVGTDYATRSAA